MLQRHHGLLSKKWAFRLFREEQLKSNPTLAGLSAVQKGKVVERLFSDLSEEDRNDLIRRSALYRSQKAGGDFERQVALANLQRQHALTSFDIFAQEQMRNPSFMGIASIAERRNRMMDVFNSLPDSTKEALEVKAHEANEARRAVALGEPQAVAKPAPHTALKKSKPAKKSKSPSRVSKLGATVKTTATTRREEKRTDRVMGTVSVSESAQAEAVGARKKLSAYTTFVKAEMEHFKHLPTRDRMKAISEKWKALKQIGKPSAEVPEPAEAASASTLTPTEPTTPASVPGRLPTPAPSAPTSPPAATVVAPAPAAPGTPGATAPLPGLSVPRTAEGQAPAAPAPLPPENVTTPDHVMPDILQPAKPPTPATEAVPATTCSPEVSAQPEIEGLAREEPAAKTEVPVAVPRVDGTSVATAAQAPPNSLETPTIRRPTAAEAAEPAKPVTDGEDDQLFAEEFAAAAAEAGIKWEMPSAAPTSSPTDKVTPAAADQVPPSPIVTDPVGVPPPGAGSEMKGEMSTAAAETPAAERFVPPIPVTGEPAVAANSTQPLKLKKKKKRRK